MTARADVHWHVYATDGRAFARCKACGWHLDAHPAVVDMDAACAAHRCEADAEVER